MLTWGSRSGRDRCRVSVVEPVPQPPSVHLVLQDGLPASAGNRITADRLRQALEGQGARVFLHEVADLRRQPPPGPRSVVHALHAVRAGIAALDWADAAPVVWTFTGTDLDPDQCRTLEGSASEAVSACVAYHEAARDDIAACLPGLAPRLHLIPPGVPVPSRPTPNAGSGTDEAVLLLPAGLRPVKEPDLALAVVADLAARGSAARLLIAGPARDEGFAQPFLERAAANGHATYLGEVPHGDMARLYAQATLVLNTSRMEGLSNAVLEAMAAGCAVLATDIAGNRAAIRHGIDGWLSPPSGLASAALRLCADAALRARLGEAARQSVAQRFSVRAEAEAHLRLYRSLVAVPDLCRHGGTRPL